MEYLNYYLFTKIINNTDEYIKSKFNYTDCDLLSYLSFKIAPKYYARKDKYDLYNRFKTDTFNDLIVECSINLDKENDFDNLLFIYGLIISNTSFKLLNEKEIDSFKINKYISEKYNISFDMNFYKENHKKIDYKEKMDHLVHNPLIKIYNFFGSYNYFIRAYKKYKKNFKKELKQKDIPVEYNFDEIVFDNVRITNIDDYIEFIYNEIKIKIDSLNEYLINNNDKKIRIEFNIAKEKKI